MAGPRKKICVRDEVVMYEMLQGNGYTCSSDSAINVNSSSCSEQRISSDKDENVSDNSSMQHGIWAKSGAERPCFPFTDKPGIN
jgi:hypothetical protein